MRQHPDRIVVHGPGVSSWKADLDGVVSFFHHYTGHPGRRGSWADVESRKYAGGRAGQRWRQEQEGDPSARPGESLWAGFVRERNVISDAFPVPQLDDHGSPTGHFHYWGLDAGGTVPNAVVEVENSPGPTWKHPQQGEIPILKNGQWTVYGEIYEPSCPTERLRTYMYRDAMIYLGLKQYEPLQRPFPQVGHLSELFCDPAAKQMRIDLESHESLPIIASIGHDKLDQRLNDRAKGMELVNALFLPQRDCCGLRYYGEHVRCERCFVDGPAIPALRIMERCENLIRELQLQVKPKVKEHEEAPDTKPAGKVPQHATDSMRYCLVGATTTVPARRKEIRTWAEKASYDAFSGAPLALALKEHVERQERVRVDNSFSDLSGWGDPDA